MARWAEFLALNQASRIDSGIPAIATEEIKLSSERLARKVNNRTYRFHGAPLSVQPT